MILDHVREPIWLILDQHKFPGQPIKAIQDENYVHYGWYRNIQFTTDKNGDTTRFTGIDGNRVWRKKSDSSHIITYQYNDKHQKVSEKVTYVDAHSIYKHSSMRNIPGFGLGGYSKIEYVYDSLDRIIKLKTYMHYTLRTVAERRYDKKGRIIEEVKSYMHHYPEKGVQRHSSIEYYYHPNGILKSITRFNRALQKDKDCYTFNKAGRVTEIAYYKDGKPSTPDHKKWVQYWIYAGPQQYKYKDDTLLKEVLTFRRDSSILKYQWHYNDKGQIIEKRKYVNDLLTQEGIIRTEYNLAGQPIWRRIYSPEEKLIEESRYFGEQQFPLDPPKKRMFFNRKKK